VMKEPWNIPQIWKWVEIKALGDIVAGGTPSTKEMSYWGDDVNWISPADLTGYTKKTIARGAKNLTHKGLAKSSARLMPAGSIHFSSRAPIGYVAISSEPLSTNQGFKSLVPAQGVFNEYVYYYLKAAKYIAEERASGTTFREISGTAFGKLPLPFPPFLEQNQIVAKIEELFFELDNGIENLKKAREQLKTYRQAVLKYAFEGKLTNEWRVRQREAGKPPEPAKKLPEQIKAERKKHYQKQLEDWKMACEQAKADGKKKPVKPKKPKELPPLTEKELTELPELPEGWCWTKVGCISESMKNGIYKPKDFYAEKGIPCLRMYNIENGKIEWFDIKRMILSEDEVKEYELRPGDLLVNRVNSRELVGKTALIKKNMEKSVYESKNIRLRLANSHKIKSGYVNFWFLIYANGYFNRNAQQTVGMASINQQQLGKMPFPICCATEQNQVFLEIESRLSTCDKMEQTIEDSIKKAEVLRQSILKKAFGGELTKDWRGKHPELVTGENSAEKLLEKINAEKALSTTGQKKPRSKKMKSKKVKIETAKQKVQVQDVANFVE